MKEAETTKKCFVIAPIGEEGSEIRNRSDKVLEHIITPTVEECGYESIRADEISEPGIITSQIIQHLIDDDLVIADLTGRNPNVYYELAIRHVVKKPIVQIIQAGESIPFDVAGTRTIHVDHRDLDSVANCKRELINQIHSVEKDPSRVDTPISVAIDLEFLRKSENPLEKSSAEIISMLQDIRSMVSDIGSIPRHPRLDPRMSEELFMNFDRLASVLDLPPNEEPSREHFEHAQQVLYRAIPMLEKFAIESGLPHDMVEHFIGRIRHRQMSLPPET
jgi:hypothetical protein